MTRSFDVMVLGAGMVGVSAALHLQARGRSVALIDKLGAAGLETSYGNAGLLHRESLGPLMLPLDWWTLLRYGANQAIEARYHVNALPQLLPWLMRYAWNSTAANAARIASAANPLIVHCVEEHNFLAAAAEADHLLRRTGWIKVFRSEKSLESGAADARRLADLGVRAKLLDAAGMAQQEPFLSGALGGLHYLDSVSVPDPGGLVKAYAALFVARGGSFIAGDAASLAQSGSGWRVMTGDGGLDAREAVVALGPWAGEMLKPLGYNIPMQLKRGYHMHFETQGNAVLNHPVFDAEQYFVLAPMNQGIRLTTGGEFARYGAPPTPVQLDWLEPIARQSFPIGARKQAEPWMGRRPCMPDMLPVIGRAPRHKGLWFDFGHQHHGFTQGPVSGRLLAEMMTGEAPFTDPTPYRLERFG